MRTYMDSTCVLGLISGLLMASNLPAAEPAAADNLVSNGSMKEGKSGRAMRATA